MTEHALAAAHDVLLLDLDDLQAMLTHFAERADELTVTYGNVSKHGFWTGSRTADLTNLIECWVGYAP